jgi:hypothetical protein
MLWEGPIGLPPDPLTPASSGSKLSARMTAAIASKATDRAQMSVSAVMRANSGIKRPPSDRGG